MRRLLFVFLLLLPITAHADWQWTKWGMTVDEVIAGSSGTVGPFERTEAPDSQIHLLAKGAYSTLDLDFEANFYFNPANHGLSLISLNMKAATYTQCLKLKDAMVDVYGPPPESSTGGILNESTARWRDEKTKNRIFFMMYQKPDTCCLQYTPIVDKAKIGL